MAGQGGGGGEPSPEKDTVRETLRSQAAAPLALIVADGATAATYPLVANGRLLVGRSRATCDIVVANESMSREHAILCLEERITVEDLGSSNGTTVGGRRAQPRVPARVDLGQVITMGSVRLVVAAMVADVEVGPDPSVRDEEDPHATVAVLAHGEMVVCEPAMRALYRVIDRIAPSAISVLVLGETGVGKDVVASAVHERSGRRGKPFVRINCAALSESLLESELFGHEAGAFTGSRGAKPGLLETAQGGTAFLDEVGELPAVVQAKLLHVLETRQVSRLGGLRPRPLDVRFVSATNRELQREVDRGAFRRDLFFRLNGATLCVPPLRERPGEIELLARLFARGACAQLGRAKEVSFSPDALAVLRGYSWPGNAREVKNVVHRAVLLCQDDRIARHDLALMDGPSKVEVVPARPAANGVEPVPSPQTEREQIMAALEACAGNQSRAAEMLGIPRRTLVKRLVTYDIPRPRKDVAERKNADARHTVS